MLTVPVEPDRQRATAAARLWFGLATDRLVGEFAAAVRANPVRRRYLSELNCGDVWAVVGTTLHPSRGYVGEPWEWDAPYSPAAWEELLRKLGDLPAVASFEASTWSARGWHGPPQFSVAMAADGGFAELGTTIDPAGQPRVLDTIREVAEIANPVAGGVAAGYKLTETPLEQALGRFAGRAEAGIRLRGYGWLTVLGDELTERVGGLGRLRASGAFVEAEPLGAGGTWLLATETWDEYGPEHANRLFELLAPVLPPGKPKLSALRPPDVVAERDPTAP
jgi:hypothetical protein